MSKSLQRIAAVALTLLTATLQAAAQDKPVAAPASPPSKFVGGSTWVNDDGSELAIVTITPSGMISGTITTKVGCGAGKAHPVTGWFYAAPNGGALTFTASWAGCNSVTSWSGQFNNIANRFQALWLLTVASAPTLNGVAAGSHHFVPAKK
ncbi:MAG: avidin/streptavidin family protein [Pseudolabrys sp.]